MHDMFCAADRTNCPSGPLHMLVVCLGRQGHRAPWAGFCSVSPGAGDDGASRFASVDVVVMPCRHGAGPWSPTPGPGTSSRHPVDEDLQVCSGVSRGTAGSQSRGLPLTIYTKQPRESPAAYLESKSGPDARPGKGSHGPPPQVAQPIMETESHSFFTSLCSVPFA